MITWRCLVTIKEQPSRLQLLQQLQHQFQQQEYQIFLIKNVNQLQQGGGDKPRGVFGNLDMSSLKNLILMHKIITVL